MIISTIIPVLDDPKGLTATLQSLPREPNLEVILIDGGSSHATRSVIQAHAARFAYSESGQDSGIADAMNRGLAQAHGEVVAILNAGDTWFPHTLELAHAALRDHPASDIYHGTVEYVSQEGTTHRVEPDVEQLPFRMSVFHPTMFVRKDCYDRLGGYDPAFAYAMDSEWCHRAAAAGARFHRIDQPLARMALGGRSDVHYVAALREYRRSVIRHQLASPWRAHASFAIVLAGKWAARTPPLKQLVNLTLRSALSRSNHHVT